MHVLRAHLDLERPALRPDHGRVQRPVAVQLRHRDVVLEPAGHRLPERVDQAERAVAVARSLLAGALDEHAHRGQVVDLVELATLLHHLVVDGVEVLRAAGDLRGDVRLVELLLEDEPGLADVLLTVGAALGDHRLDLGVLAGVQRLEREVLELPLEGVDTEAVRERRVDLERLARLLHLLLLAEVLDRAEVVEAVGELDQDHADVLGHRDDQLPVVLGLGVLAALELDPRQLGDAVDELGDLVAELVLDRLQVGVGVLDDVVEERGRDRRLVHAELGEDLGDAERVVDELLARPALLAVVRLGRERERSREQIAVEIGLVALDRLDQLIDELLMTLGYLEYGHIHSVLRAAGAKPSAAAYPGRRKNRCDKEDGCLAQKASIPKKAGRRSGCPARRADRRRLSS